MKIPSYFQPQLARSTPHPPTGSSWVHEIKHDGHRVIVCFQHGNVRLFTRSGYNATQRFAPVADMLAQLAAKRAVIDGEVAVPDERGVTNISLLDDALASASLHQLAFYAFDMLFLNGKDLRAKQLAERKHALSKLLADPPPRLLYSEHLACDGRALFEKVGELGCEGIVSKRIDAPYTSGPSKTWLKCKHSAVGAFTVIGYEPDGRVIESLLVAENRAGSLRPAGLVEFRRPGVLNDDAHRALAYLTRPEPCIRIGRSSARMRWVEPRLIASVKYFGRTGTGALRAGVLQNLSVA